MELPTLSCSQCGRAAPADPDELGLWKHGDLALAAELDPAAVSTMLLCPACVEEDDARAYDEGAGD